MVKLKENKSLSENKPIEILPAPNKVYIPLTQHIGKTCNLLDVKVGDNVLVGQRLATSDGKVSAPIHSSVSGKISAIQSWPHPVLGKSEAIVIENDSLYKTLETKLRTQSEINNLTPDDIRKIVSEAGIVGMGGASFPTHIKLSPPKQLENLIINGAECEPYLTADYRIMVEKTNEIILGIGVIQKCLNIKNVFIAIEDNKPEAIAEFKKKIQGTNYQVKVLKSQYPQGGEKQLIRSVLNKEVPSGKLPLDIETIVQNVSTTFAIYEAVYKNKPLYERVLTVTGSCISNPRNLLVRIGTPIKEAIDFCGPLKEEPEKIIIGGPMMGIAQYTDMVPVIKSTTGIILMNKKEAQVSEELPCIRCGACVRECPCGLMPCLMNMASNKWMWAKTKEYAVMDCIECGACNYVCPANRKLTQSIKRAKLEATK